jgi:hypothetical protein
VGSSDPDPNDITSMPGEPRAAADGRASRPSRSSREPIGARRGA